MNNEFDIYKLAIEEYEEYEKIVTSLSSNETSQEIEVGCTHININNEKGINVCTDCGKEIGKKVTHNKEWRFYGGTDSRGSVDPNRVISRKDTESNIYKDVENMGFSEKIVSQANLIYKQVTDNKIFRNNSRKSIIFASIFHSYKLNNTPQSHEKLINVFNLDKKSALKGLKYVSLNAPKESCIITSYITPVNLMGEIMEKFHAKEEHIQEVIEIYEKIKNKSSKINRSRPLSISASIIYYWIRKTKREITLKEFSSKISLSDLTITKLSKEIAKILSDETTFL